MDRCLNCCSITLCTLLAYAAAVVTVLISARVLLILLWTGIVEHAVAVSFPVLSFPIALLLVPLLLRAVVRALVLIITPLIGALVLRPATAVLIVSVAIAMVVVPIVAIVSVVPVVSVIPILPVMLAMPGVLVLLRPLLRVPRLLMQAGVVVVLPHLALLAVDARRLAIALSVWLHNDYTRLRLMYLARALMCRVVWAGIGAIGAAHQQQGRKARKGDATKYVHLIVSLGQTTFIPASDASCSAGITLETAI